MYQHKGREMSFSTGCGNHGNRTVGGGLASVLAFVLPLPTFAVVFVAPVTMPPPLALSAQGEVHAYIHRPVTCRGKKHT